MKESCVFCGGEIIFRNIRGVTVPIHEGGENCIGRNLYRNEKSDLCHFVECPKCSSGVYFVRHNGGSVWFDELGHPWPKHGCFDKSTDFKFPPPEVSGEYRIAKVACIESLKYEQGFVLHIDCPGEPFQIRYKVLTDPETHDLSLLNKKNIFFSKPLRKLQTFGGDEYIINSYTPVYNQSYEHWYYRQFGSTCPLCSSGFGGDKIEHLNQCSNFVWASTLDNDENCGFITKVNKTSTPVCKVLPKRYLNPDVDPGEEFQKELQINNISVRVKYFDQETSPHKCFIVGSEVEIKKACEFCRNANPPIDVVYHIKK